MMRFTLTGSLEGVADILLCAPGNYNDQQSSTALVKTVILLYIFLSFFMTLLSQEHCLDFQKLLDASEYKENYRADMIRWGEEKRNQDAGFFCRLATSEKGSGKDIWIISDARRKSDIDYFKKFYGTVTTTVRVQSDLDVRKARGFVFTEGE